MTVTDIPADLVKRLRDETGAGMMECKRALQETNGDFDAAKRLLRERGMAAAGRLAMHISFAAPRFGTADEISAEELASERAIYEQQPDVQSKPDEVRAKIVEGRLRKEFLSGAALSEQAWIHDPSLTAGKALEQAGLEVLEFVRYALAE